MPSQAYYHRSPVVALTKIPTNVGILLGFHYVVQAGLELPAVLHHPMF